ncbi:RNA-guided endonuclease InsQ/TnpB family protein [Hydrogenimonas cancrithermarum]|uniref:Transposase n=1 Tax=Hydrogenimonas cancrithermarum TaxID=2993563 RepID=A0ABN6WXJ1_9BACT|nr:transposase [Hydrogenimonas cancrithermarum]BDY13976.1 transposase [Hydrogenimonas cancrithermarum]
MLKAVKVRLYPSNEQKRIISSQIGGARYVYNRTLALRKYAYQKLGIKVGKFALIKHITKLKKRKKTAWLKEIDSQAIQQSIANMDKAYQHFFKGGGYPKFKSRHHSRQSYQYPQRVKIEGNKVFLPKVGWVKMKGWREEFAGKIKTVTVSYEAYQYHASILIDTEEDKILKPCNNINKAIGLDVGVALMVADSSGKKHKPLDLTKELEKLRRAAQSVSRKKKGSNNRAKAKAKLTKINLKIANKRKDFLHKLSLQYAENQGIVVVEDLKIKNMTKSAKGTKEKPGKSVKAKAGLNRVITQQSWGMFFEFLEYKLKERGGQLIKVDPKFTSQTCPKCGHISKNNRKSQSKFVCESCGFSENADVVGAKNILVRGIHGNNASLQIAV